MLRLDTQNLSFVVLLYGGLHPETLLPNFNFDLLEPKEYDKNREKNWYIIDKKSTFLYNEIRKISGG